MASKAITDAPAASKAPRGAEVSPSVMRTDDPGISRYVGFAGAVLVFFGGIFLIAQVYFSKGGLIGPGWATMMLALGLVGLLYHAAFDRDLQFRRAYMTFAYAALAVGAGLSLYPYPNKMGDQFPAGFLCMSVGLIFLLAFLRNEDELVFRQLGQNVLLGVGGILLAVGLLGGNLDTDFLLGIGLLCSLLGIVYVTAYLAIRGVSDDRAYYIGLGLGGVAAVVFVIAFVRSAFYPGETGSFFVPNGLLLMVIAAVAGMVSVGFCSDAIFVVLTRRELAAFFFSPLAYFVLFAFALSAEFNFAVIWLFPMFQENAPMPEPIVSRFLYGFLPVVVTIVAIPVLTMRLFSEEWRSGTLEVMLTAPVSEPLVVLSKFFAAMFMFVLVWLPFALFLVAFRVMGAKPFDYRPMLAFTVVLLVTGSSMTSLGLFCSSMTRNQLVSGVVTFSATTLMTVIWFVRSMLERDSTFIAVVKHVSYLELWNNAMEGKLILPGLVFHASMTVLFLFLSVKMIEARKWL